MFRLSALQLVILHLERDNEDAAPRGRGVECLLAFEKDLHLFVF